MTPAPTSFVHDEHERPSLLKTIAQKLGQMPATDTQGRPIPAPPYPATDPDPVIGGTETQPPPVPGMKPNPAQGGGAKVLPPKAPGTLLDLVRKQLGGEEVPIGPGVRSLDEQDHN